jgi:hypothetical protein
MKKKLKSNKTIYAMTTMPIKTMKTYTCHISSPFADIQECKCCGLRFDFNKTGLQADRANYENGQRCPKFKDHFCSPTCLKATISREFREKAKIILETITNNIEKCKVNMRRSLANGDSIHPQDMAAAKAYQFQKKFMESASRCNYYEVKVLYETQMDKMSDFAEECLAGDSELLYMNTLNFSAIMGSVVKTLKTYHEM